MYLGKNEWVLNFPYQTSVVYKVKRESYFFQGSAIAWKQWRRNCACALPSAQCHTSRSQHWKGAWLLWSTFHSSLICFLWPSISSFQIFPFPFLWETSPILTVFCKDSAFGEVPVGTFPQLSWVILKEKTVPEVWAIGKPAWSLHVVETWFITDI